ncbi:phage tail protein I [Variovorax sp. YR216]|uniref:phage tail protein I n=1 Tax=Variovorax sp. YR216 TaxID=1882828 RepID=UPI0015A019EA|nr:phage tail protein I [Variovorax sp. YR216]
MARARLLPPNRTALESALAAMSSLVLDTAGLRHLWHARDCLAELLPWLSWTLSVEGWSDARSDDARRAVILDSINIHRRKGTPWAIRALIRALGFGEITIIERIGGIRRDGTAAHDGEYARAPLSSTWATYRLVFDRPLTNAQAARVRALLPSVAPARCLCVGLRYAAVVNSHNGAMRRDGSFNRGSA